MSGARVLVAALCASMLGGCAEFYRWPDRMAQKKPAPMRRAELPAEGHYVVKPGDTMYSIAFRYQLDFRELAAWNDVGPDYLIVPGQVVRLKPPPVGEGIRTIPTQPQEPQPQPQATQRPPVARPAVPLPERPAESVAKFAWRWPMRGAVLKEFSDGGKGVDISGDVGQAVHAAAPGKVVYSGAALKGYGELIIIKHDDVHLSAYGYNRRRLVDEGAVVTAGQPIAELGVGPEQKPALHFEIRKRGKPVDPKQYLPPA